MRSDEKRESWLLMGGVERNELRQRVHDKGGAEAPEGSLQAGAEAKFCLHDGRRQLFRIPEATVPELM